MRIVYAIIAVVLVIAIGKHLKGQGSSEDKPDFKLGVLTVLLALDVFFLVSAVF
jgi:hypothetical protein